MYRLSHCDCRIEHGEQTVATLAASDKSPHAVMLPDLYHRRSRHLHPRPGEGSDGDDDGVGNDPRRDHARDRGHGHGRDHDRGRGSARDRGRHIDPRLHLRLGCHSHTRHCCRSASR